MTAAPSQNPLNIVARRFREDLPEGQNRQPRVGPLDDFREDGALVILGEPGSGKTTAFEEAQRSEPNAICVSAADFLYLSLDNYRGKMLFIDGLDEQRALSRGRSVFDEIRRRLDDLGRPRFRLSCRTGDWRGNSDAMALTRVAPAGVVTALHLEPLTQEDMREAIRDHIPDTSDFLNRAASFGIEDLLTNPQTLGMLLTVILDKGRWPSSKANLYDEATKVLGRELSEVHERGKYGGISLDAIREASGLVCTILLLGGSQGFALSAPAEVHGFPYVRNVLGDESHLEATLRRRLFKSAGTERVIPAHRTIAEYLAAKYIATRIAGGFPFSRALALIKTDHGIPANLRGLYAWLACLCPGKTDALIAEDPLAVVLQGDPRLLTPGQKRAIFAELQRLSTRDPHFRAGLWDTSPFGALSCPELAPFFKKSLRKAADIDTSLLVCMLDAIEHGEQRLDVGNELLAIVEDPRIAAYPRDKALRVFIANFPARSRELLSLLDRVHRGEIKDEREELRGTLLENLYPHTVTPSLLIKYIVKPDPSLGGTYYMLLARGFVAATPANQLPALLEAVLGADFEEQWKHEPFWRSFIGRLLVSVLEAAGDSASPEQLFTWLGSPLDKHGYADVRADEANAIRTWLQARPEKIKALFDVWLTACQDEHVPRAFWNLLNYRLVGGQLPRDFGAWLLEKARQRAADSRAGPCLFALATSFAFNRQGALTFEDLLDFVAEHPGFSEQFKSLCSCPIDEQHIAMRERFRKIEAEHAAERREFRGWLTTNLNLIRSGRDWGALTNLARIYFGHHPDSKRDSLPIDRLISTTTEEIAYAALEGFVAALRADLSELTPEKVGRARAEQKSYVASDVILAGMELLAARGMDEIDRIPEETLLLAVIFCLESEPERYDDTWLGHLIESRPELVISALHDYYEAQFRAAKPDDTFVPYQLHQDKRLAPIARELVPRYLRQYSGAAPKALQSLFRAGLMHCHPSELADIAEEVLARRPAPRGVVRVQWLAFLLLLRPEKAGGPLARMIGRFAERALTLLDVFDIPLAYDATIRIPVLIQSLVTCIRVAGRLYPPERFARSGQVFRCDNTTSKLQRYISLLSNDDSAEGTAALQDLLDDRALAAWRDQLKHALALQRRKRCDAEYRAPSVEQIARALASDKPASVADFQALLCETLDTIRNTIRNASPDGWQAFWDRKGRTPKSENECRNRLKERLDAELSRLGVIFEPEALYAETKRADLKAIFGEWQIPVEIKRHYHRELWKAPARQLATQYARDPASHRRGIFLVLYFGTAAKPIPKSPSGVAPRTAAELEEALTTSIPADWAETLSVKVIDVSAPTRKGPRSASRRSGRRRQ